jgi:hypothetical protein
MKRVSKKETARTCAPYAEAVQRTLDCQRCGAKAGERCKNYKGQAKATCKVRGLVVSPDASPPPPDLAEALNRPVRQALLWEALDPEGSEVPR